MIAEVTVESVIDQEIEVEVDVITIEGITMTVEEEGMTGIIFNIFNLY
jgi:hypothetical protein